MRRLDCTLSGGSQRQELKAAVKKWEDLSAPLILAAGNASRTELQLLFLSNLFYNAQYFLSREYFVYLLHPQIRLGLWRAGTPLPPQYQVEEPGPRSSSMHILP